MTTVAIQSLRLSSLNSLAIPARTVQIPGNILHFTGNVRVVNVDSTSFEIPIFEDEIGIKYEISVSQLLNAEGTIQGLIARHKTVGEFLENLAQYNILISDVKYIDVPAIGGGTRAKKVLTIDLV